MPDLNELLESAASDLGPCVVPPFSDVERRLRRRRARRATSSLGIVLVATGAVVGLAALLGGHPANTPATTEPCVSRTAQNAQDTFVAIPTTGVRYLELPVGGVVTLGWQTCGETGTIEPSSTTNDPKHPYLIPPGGQPAPDTTDKASARFEAFRVGTVTVAARGTAGSHGSIAISIVPAVEPVGGSAPSPFPGEQVYDGVPNLCLTPDAADAQGRITKTVTFDSALLAPAPGVRSTFTASQILSRFHADDQTRGVAGDAKAYFGRFTNNYQNPFPKARPLWVVVVCGGPLEPGSGGGASLGPTPAPGTSPAPGGRYLGIVSVAYDEHGRSLGESISGYADAALRAERLFEVPFERTQQDLSDGRQVGLAYRSDDSCATFDHLDVAEPRTGPVYVHVWLRLTNGHDICSGTSNTHNVIVGLREPLARRLLLRGVPPR